VFAYDGKEDHHLRLAGVAVHFASERLAWLYYITTKNGIGATILAHDLSYSLDNSISRILVASVVVLIPNLMILTY
jgi:hypothetical protein